MLRIHLESKVHPYLCTDGTRMPSVLLFEKDYPLTPGNYARALCFSQSNDKDAQLV